MADFLLRPSTVARVFDMSTRALYSLIQSGKLEACNVNPGGKGGIRVSRDSVLTYLKQYSFPEKYSLDIP